MITNIRHTTLADIERVMELYQIARNYMRSEGNTEQWVNGYPSKEYILAEMENGHSYVCEDENNNIVGTFCLIIGEEPTYKKIYNGKWLNAYPYATLHRIASQGGGAGVVKSCFDFSFSKCKNIRVDTHADNKTMNNAIKKYGFTYCGIIYIADGTPRLAYQKYIP
ncbi:MAG: GNAT family N-acetyltransferase [Bacteroidales bacterium]|jgi:hypothetical protein